MKTIQLLSLLSGMLLFEACSPTQSQTQEGTIQEYPVSTLQAKDAVLNTDYTATIQGQQNIEIRPKVDGFVEQILVDEGAVVKKGQLLFKINAPQYEQEVRTAAAAIKNAEAEVNTAKMQVEKTLPLVKEEIISNYELKQANFNLHAKEAALAQAKASLANARTNLGYTNISSPADGVVGNLPYKTGSLVSSSSPQPLTTVSNIASVFAYFSFNEKQFLDFTENNKGKTIKDKLLNIPPVILLLANGTEYSKKGKLETLSGLINTETGSVNLRASFPNPDGLIRSGASALIRIPLKVSNVLLVPAKATFEMQEKTMVYTVKNGAVKSAEIEIMDIPSGEFYVVTKGLNPGEQIVTEGMGSLKDGMKIKAKQ